MAMPKSALLVDQNGILDVSAYQGKAAGAWRTPVGVSGAGLPPGAPAAVLAAGKDTVIVIMVDAAGTLTAIELDLSGGVTQKSLTPIGASAFPPGAPVALFESGGSGYAAALVDLAGMLNVASVDLSGTTPAWTGPVMIGNGNLVPGSHLAVAQGFSAVSLLLVDNDGLFNVATFEIATGTWQGPNPVGNAGLVPGSHVSVG
jgi:hypothetical protein